MQPRRARLAQHGRIFAMAWIAALAGMIGGMVVLSSIGAELSFRRTLEPSER
jgi:membrane associated rhomboid family serine protease